MLEQTEPTEPTESLPAGVEFSPEFVREVRRRIGFEGLFLAGLLKEVTGRFDPVLTSAGRPGVTYDASCRMVGAIKQAIRETEQGPALAPEGLDRIWRALLDKALRPGLGSLEEDLVDRGDWEAYAIECHAGRMEALGGPEARFWREVKATEVCASDGGPPQTRNGEPAIPRARVRDSFDSYAHAIGQIVLRLSVERPELWIRVRHCEDSLLEALTQP